VALKYENPAAGDGWAPGDLVELSGSDAPENIHDARLLQHPARVLGENTALVAIDQRRRQKAHRVASLGIRPSVELIVALVDQAGDTAAAESLLERFAQMDPAQLVVTGADRMPASIIREVAR
jgi:hypothetical protein